MKVYLAIHIQKKRFVELMKTSEKYDILKKKNIIITENINEADLLIFLINSSKNMTNINETDKKMLKESNVPVVILERFDSSVSWFREFDMIPNLKAIIKNRLIEPIENMNSEYFYGRYHYRLMYDTYYKETNTNKFKEKDLSNSIYSGLKTLSTISPENLKKFHHILWDFNSSPLSKTCRFFRNSEIDFNKIRTHDVFCVNRNKSGIQGWARNKAKFIINNMKDLNVVTNGLSQNDYNEKLINSKIGVACWGWGEWIHMDASAMYGGTILIKPDSGYIRMYPEIYINNKTYIPCKPDYSDLEEKIRYILDNYDNLLDMRKKNREFLLSINHKNCTEKFWDKIQELKN